MRGAWTEDANFSSRWSWLAQYAAISQPAYSGQPLSALQRFAPLSVAGSSQRRSLPRGWDVVLFFCNFLICIRLCTVCPCIRAFGGIAAAPRAGPLSQRDLNAKARPDERRQRKQSAQNLHQAFLLHKPSLGLVSSGWGDIAPASIFLQRAPR